MKTPHAILIGLTVIAAALLFREPSVSPAHAYAEGDDVDGFLCGGELFDKCFILKGDFVTTIEFVGVEDPEGVPRWFTTKRAIWNQ